MKSLQILLAVLCIHACAASQLAPPAPGLTIDGKLDDSFWQTVPAHAVVPAEPGVPARLGGEVRFALRGAYLCFGARLPEPGGKVLARSIGRNPVWEKDAPGSPSVEDRVRYWLQYRSVAGAVRNLTVTINPWGAYRVEEAGAVIPDAVVLQAAQVTPDGWTVEAAIPLGWLDLDRRTENSTIRLRAERIRSRRPLAPEFRWFWPSEKSFDELRLPERTPSSAEVGRPEVRPPALGNMDPLLEVGRVPRLPAMTADWDDPAWRGIPAFTLPRNEPYPRAPRYPTKVRWMHDGRTLALLFRMEEPEPVVARAEGRDSAVTSDDHVAVYLAASGSAFLEIAVNSVGAIQDSLGAGPHSMRLNSGWNGDIQTRTNIRHGYWIARVNIPLEQCAAALGEEGVPGRWRILIARYRAARPGEEAESSTLPPVGRTLSFYGPARYQAMVLRNVDPLEARLPSAAYLEPPAKGIEAELAALDSRVWSPSYRRRNAVRSMLRRYLDRSTEEAVLAEREAWDKVATRAEWERFRDQRIQALKESVGKFPPERSPLESRVTAAHEGEGYRLENIVFQSRPGFYMTGNLYLPARRSAPAPGMIIVHSQHYPKTQGELHDMGELWARAGAVVLIMERPGYGERAETTTWYRQAYASRFTFTKQLFLVGESYSGWAAWDVIRCVDFLFDRPEIDRSRIIVLGSVAGGGEPAAVAAALDNRITAVAPFNYDQGHVRVHGDSPGQIAKQFSPWLVAASVAPRKFIRAFEFSWEGAEEPDYPLLWVDGMKRSEKVWSFYNAGENLASSEAYGLIRLSKERVSHCFSIGPQQRVELYPILNRWFNIAMPTQRDLEILPDSDLTTNPYREEARRQEAQRRRPLSDLLSITPEVSAQLHRKSLHEIAFEMGKAQLAEARGKRRSLGAGEQAQRLREDLKPLLGDIEPAAAPKVEVFWKKTLSAAEAEAISLEVESGIQVPLLLLRPKTAAKAAVVVAVAQAGKERFLASRPGDIANLLHAGVAVCLPDVRGTGESSSSPDRHEGDSSLALREFDLARNLLGDRLKDLRTVLAYLRQRDDIDRRRIAVWGDSFSPPNSKPLFLDEIEYEAGPQIQHWAEPLGAHLALLAGLYEPDLRAIAARRGLAGYLTVLENAFTYTPLDAIVLGLLKAGDIPDIAAALAPRPLLLEGAVNGRNIRLEENELKSAFEPAEESYRSRQAAGRLAIHREPGDVAVWLAAQLQ